MAQAAWIDLGFVARTHGVRGTVWVHWHDAHTPLNPFPKLLQLTLPGRKPVVYAVQAHRRHKGGTLVDLAQVGTMDAAQALKGAAVAVAEDALPKEAPGEVYLYRLVGALCQAENGKPLGVLQNIYDHGATVLLGIVPHGPPAEPRAADKANDAGIDTGAAFDHASDDSAVAEELLVPLFDDTLRQRLPGAAGAPQTIVLRLLPQDTTP